MFRKIGEYKSAPEAITHAGPSEPARPQTDALLDDAYRLLLGELGAARHMTRERAAQVIDGGPYTVASLRSLLPAALRDPLRALPASLLDSPDAAQARMDERIVIR